MSEVKNYNQIFTAGMSKSEFIKQYKELATGIEKKEKSVFFDELDEKSIGLIYDTIHISQEENLTDDDIATLSGLDGDTTNISDDDIEKVYEKLQKTYKNATVTTGAIDSGSNNVTPSESIDFLHTLKILTMIIADTKKNQIQNEISQLINNGTLDLGNLKTEYNELATKIKTAEAELKTKNREYDTAKDRILRIKEEISRKQGEIDGTQDDAKKEQLQKEITTLSDSLSRAEQALTPLSDTINSLTTKIKKDKTSLAKLTDKITYSDKETSEKIKEKQQELAGIDTSLMNEISDIDTRIQESERLQLEYIKQAGRDSAKYEDMANGTVTDGTVGKNASQALANATSQIGVREETGHNDGAQIAKYRNGVDNNAAWCASFVSWCYKGNDIFGYQASVSGIQMAAQKQNLYAEKGTYTPKAGDIMIQKNGASHTGIVESVDPDGTIHTIEGNSSNQVRRVTYKVGSKGYNQISGWVKMSE